MRKSFLIMALFGLAVGGSTACATKGYVRTQVGQVNSKVDSPTVTSRHPAGDRGTSKRRPFPNAI